MSSERRRIEVSPEQTFRSHDLEEIHDREQELHQTESISIVKLDP